MDLADQSQADRQRLEPLEAILQSRHVVVHLADIRPSTRLLGVSLEQVQLLQTRLSALDPGTQYRFAANRRPNEQMRVGEHASETREFAQEAASFGEQPDERQRVVDLRRQRARHKGPIACGRSDDLSRSVVRELFRFHQNAIRFVIIAFWTQEMQ